MAYAPESRGGKNEGLPMQTILSESIQEESCRDRVHVPNNAKHRRRASRVLGNIHKPIFWLE